MAHSIRAVQELLEGRGKGRHWITVTFAPIFTYLRRRAIARISPEETEIIVASEIDLEAQRLAIAHELAHLIFVKLGGSMSFVTKEAAEKQVTARALIEGACAIFEKDLCKRHHNFYITDGKRERLLFKTLKDYPSPGD